MDITARMELAQHIRRTYDIREASWMAGNGVNSSGCYTVSYEAAMKAAQVPQELRIIILCLLVPGYADVLDWADAQLDQYGTDVSSAPSVFTLYGIH